MRAGSLEALWVTRPEAVDLDNIKGARVRSWLEHGTREPVASMPREKLKWKPHESLSTDAGHRGGWARSSDEVPVMGMERRGRITQSRRGDNPAMGRNPA